MAKPIPFPFFLEAAGAENLRRNPMFGCWAFYRGEKVLFIVRERESSPVDNGIWVVVENGYQPEVQKILPSLRRISFFESEGPAWLNLPADSDSFEEEALAFAELVVNGDERIGRVPKAKKNLTKTKALPRVKKPSPKSVKKKAKTSRLKTKSKTVRKTRRGRK